MNILGLELRKFSFFALSLMMSLGWSSLMAGEVYRQVDAEGNVTFSDQPNPGAEKIEVAPTNVHTFPKAPAANPLQDKSEEKGIYKSLVISSPAMDTTIRDPGDVLVSAKISPALRRSHKLLYSDNGQPIGEPSRKLSMQLINLSRGTHLIQVDVVNADNKILISSAPLSIHVHRTSIIKPEAPPPTNKNGSTPPIK